MVNILLGIGNQFGGDDAIGSWIAKNFKCKDWLSIDCGTIPENFISAVKRNKPKLVVLVDSAELGLVPGKFRIVPKDKVDSVGIGTHSMPLSLLINYFEKHAKNVICIGIQPKATKPFSRLSKEVKQAGKRIIEILIGQRLTEITEV